MMQVRLTALADDLRKGGLKVVEIAGWKTRSRPESAGGFTPVGVLWHHTGALANGEDYAEWLATVGRSDLPPPLCQLSIDRQGIVYVCAAGRANHAGVAKASGSVAAGDGNTLYLGVEVQNSGTEGWTETQYVAMVKTGAVLGLKTVGCTVNAQRAHYETSVTGKWDPGDPKGIPLGNKRVLDMDKFRADVGAAMAPPPPRIFPVRHRVVTANMWVKNADPLSGVSRIVAKVSAAFRFGPDVIAMQETHTMLRKLAQVGGYQQFVADEGEAGRELGVLLQSKLKCLGVKFHPAAAGSGEGVFAHPRGIFVVRYIKRGRKVAVVNTHMGVIADETALQEGRMPGLAAEQHAEQAEQVVRIVNHLRAEGYLVFVTADANSKGVWAKSLPAVLAAAGMRVTPDGVDLIASDPARTKPPDVATVDRRLTGSDTHDAIAIRTTERKSR